MRRDADRGRMSREGGAAPGVESGRPRPVAQGDSSVGGHGQAGMQRGSGERCWRQAAEVEEAK